MIFTAVTLIFGLVTAFTNPVTATAENATTCFIFVLVNVGLLKDFFVVDYQHLGLINMKRDFPSVVYCDLIPTPDKASVFNLFGMVISSDRVFRTIIDAMILNQMIGSAKGIDYVSLLGDSIAVNRVMRIIAQAAVGDKHTGDEETIAPVGHEETQEQSVQCMLIPQNSP